MVKILSIDVGILNLGYVFCEIVNDNIIVIDCDKIDITVMRHVIIPFCNCKLNHDNCAPDYLEHFFQEHHLIFNEAHIILVERQPIIGITNIQDLILNKYRNKTLLISPNRVHKHFSMSKNYSFRKIQAEMIASPYLHDQINYKNKLRKHDIADAMLLIIFYYSSFLKKKIVEKLCNIDHIEKFRFNVNNQNT